MKHPSFPGKYHQIGGFSMAMLVYRSVMVVWLNSHFYYSKDLGTIIQLKQSIKSAWL